MPGPVPLPRRDTPHHVGRCLFVAVAVVDHLLGRHRGPIPGCVPCQRRARDRALRHLYPGTGAP